MRGNPRSQSGQIFRRLNRIGESRHAAKVAARAAGVIGSHRMAQSVGIFSYATMTKYRAVATEFIAWCRDKHGIGDAAKINANHVEEWLQIKIANGVRYKTYLTYAAALGKASAGLRAIYGEGYDWASAINQTREQARTFLDRRVKSRGYTKPAAVVERLEGVYRVAAELQLYGGARVREVTQLTEKHLLGDGRILLTNTKGGRRRTIIVPPEVYALVAEVIGREREFRFDYRRYLESLKTACAEVDERYQGSHGLRWNFAQINVRSAQELGMGYVNTLELISNRMGHSRELVTEHYLR